MVLLSFSRRYGFYYYEPETDIVYFRPFSMKSFDYWFTPGASLASILFVFFPDVVLFSGLLYFNWDFFMWIFMYVLTCGLLLGVSFLCGMKIQHSMKKEGESISLREGQKWELEQIYRAANAMGLSYIRLRGLGHGYLFIFVLCIVWRVIATLVIRSDNILRPSLFWPMVIAVLEIALYPLLITQERRRKECMQRIAGLICLSKEK